MRGSRPGQFAQGQKGTGQRGDSRGLLKMARPRHLLARPPAGR